MEKDEHFYDTAEAYLNGTLSTEKEAEFLKALQDNEADYQRFVLWVNMEQTLEAHNYQDIFQTISETRQEYKKESSQDYRSWQRLGREMAAGIVLILGLGSLVYWQFYQLNVIEGVNNQGVYRSNGHFTTNTEHWRIEKFQQSDTTYRWQNRNGQQQLVLRMATIPQQNSINLFWMQSYSSMTYTLFLNQHRYEISKTNQWTKLHN